MKNMAKYDVAVIGAGASGLIAAGKIARAGLSVVLIEKMPKVGVKLLVTGGGRCNLSNTASLEDFMTHFFPKRSGFFLRQALMSFSCDNLRDFFKQLGLETIEERGGRVFPESQKAHDVVNALQRWCKEADIFISSSVSKIEKADIFKITTSSGGLYYAENLLLSTGGASYPQTGTTGDGYDFAKRLGHTIVPIRPALVGLATERAILANIGYVDLKNIEANILIDGKKVAGLFGDMSFMQTGIGGPVILTLSHIAVDALRERKQVELSIDLKPALNSEKLDNRLIRELDSNGSMLIKNILRNLLPQKLIPICLRQCEIDEATKGGKIKSDKRKLIGAWLKDFRIPVIGYKPFSDAIITAGGVSRDEIDPRSMASKIVDGLYFSGEIIDINADTGGYNLQAAFSTGWMAAKSIIRKEVI